MPPLRYVRCTVTLKDETHADYIDTMHRQVQGASIGGTRLTRPTIDRLGSWVEAEKKYEREDLELLGRHLYDFLFGASSGLHKQFQDTYRSFRDLRHADPSLRLRLTLAFEDGARELAAWPWEFLFMDDNGSGFFVAGKKTELLLTRFVSPIDLRAITPEEQPLRILLAVSSPSGDDLGTIEADDLIADIEALQTAGRFDVRVLRNPRFSQIQGALRGGEDPDDPWFPQVFHFIGHGRMGDKHEGQLAVRMEESQERELWATEGIKDRDVMWVPTSKLQESFPEAHAPGLVFLHACRGAVKQSYRGFATGAAALVTAGVPAVIAMQYEIPNEDAKAFARTFYADIGNGKPIDEAVTDARWELATRTADSWGHRRFGTPLLFLQSEDAVILNISSDSEPVTVATAAAPVLEDCPYMYDKERPCTGKVGAALRFCPTCARPLTKCDRHGPPNIHMVTTESCMYCGKPLASHKPTHGGVQQLRVLRSDASGFGE